MKRESLTGIKLNDDEKKKMCNEIAAFYLDERDEKIGIIAQQRILDMFMENLAPVIYNKALDEAKSWHRQQMENLESDYYMLYQEE